MMFGFDLIDVTMDGDMFYITMENNQYLTDVNGCMFCYSYDFNGITYDIYWNTSKKCFEIYGGSYVLTNIDRNLYYDFCLSELIKRNFPMFMWNKEDNFSDDFEFFDDFDFECIEE